jgi:uncharacterized protein involved in exopolysaccharide biosynthesis
VTLPIAVWVVRSTEVEYSASAVVRLADTRRAMSGGLINQPAPSVRWNVDPLQSEAVLIRSRATALAVVDSTPRLRIDVSGIPEHYIGDIAVDPEATSDSVVLSFGSDSVRALRAGDADMTAAYGEQIEFPGFAFSVRRRPEANRAVVHLLSREAAGRMVRGGLWAAPRLQTDLIDISYTSLDPRRSLLIANRVAQVYQVLNAENARRESRLQREFLEEQLRVADSLVEASRRELSRFRSRRRGGFAVAAPGYGTSPQELALRVDEMRFDRGRYAELVESLDTADSADIGDVLDAIVATPVIGDNPLVTQAFGQVSGYQAEIDDLIGGGWGQAESNPDVVRLRELKLRAEDKLARAARSALRSAMTQLDARIAALEEFQQDALDRQSREGVLEIEEGQLEAQLANARERADRFRTAYQNARMSEAIEVGQVEIIELAAGALPSRSGIQQKVIMIVGLGVFLGLALAFARERLRTSIRGQEEVSALGLPILGVVPRLASGKNGSSAKDAGPVVEAMRGIRLNLVHTHGAAGTLMTTITSPDPSDGKSFVSANLALAFAHGGERVLLIDGDLRRGSLHRVMGRDRKPGLTDLLTGDAKREQVVRTTDYPGLDFIPCSHDGLPGARLHPLRYAHRAGSGGARVAGDGRTDRQPQARLRCHPRGQPSHRSRCGRAVTCDRYR